LLAAYFAEFAREERVVLRLKTYLNFWSGPAPETDLDPADAAWSGGVASRLAWFAHERLNATLESLPRLELVTETVQSREALRDLYAASDAFVLPTRGEGWGLPIAEAMSMALPVIATYWSGPTGGCHRVGLTSH